jgi:hypothetical protein
MLNLILKSFHFENPGSNNCKKALAKDFVEIKIVEIYCFTVILNILLMMFNSITIGTPREISGILKKDKKNCKKNLRNRKVAHIFATD